MPNGHCAKWHRPLKIDSFALKTRIIYWNVCCCFFLPQTWTTAFQWLGHYYWTNLYKVLFSRNSNWSRFCYQKSFFQIFWTFLAYPNDKSKKRNSKEKCWFGEINNHQALLCRSSKVENMYNKRFRRYYQKSC